MIHRLVDRIAARYAEGPHQAEAVRAREDFMERGGKVFDDDGELFEARMMSFLEWYVLDRPFRGGAPPAVRALEEDGSLTLEERREVAHLVTSHRSLFDLVRLADGSIEVEDVVGGARFAVRERRGTVGFQQGDLFEARLLWDSDAVVFGKTFLFHPPEVRDQAVKIVDDALARGVERGEILFQLSRLYIRWRRFGHLPAVRVYRGET